jgi:hypothetical protein
MLIGLAAIVLAIIATVRVARLERELGLRGPTPIRDLASGRVLR